MLRVYKLLSQLKSSQTSSVTSNEKKVILHIAGSAETDYYAKLSIWYAKQCIGSLQNKVADSMKFVLVCIHPKKEPFKESNTENIFNNAMWKFESDNNNTSYNTEQACDRLRNMNISVCIHHMFDPTGTEQFRQLLINLNIPFVGSDPNTMKISNDKFIFRTLMQKTNVPVPNGILFIKNKQTLFDIKQRLIDNNITYPMIIKPCTEDNSIGVTLVNKECDLEQAIINAFKYDNRILIEKYIQLGREIRVGIIENANGEPDIVLPCIEYGVSKTHPIRTETDKLTVVRSESSDNNIKKVYAKSRLSVNVNCEIDEQLYVKLKKYAFKAHKAIGARDFSLFDVRVDPKGNPYFIEANLFCSFAPTSVIVLMAEAADDYKLKHVQLFKYLVNKACVRRR